MKQERKEAEAKFEKKLDDYMSKTSAFMDFIVARMSNKPPEQAPSEIFSQNLDYQLNREININISMRSNLLNPFNYDNTFNNPFY